MQHKDYKYSRRGREGEWSRKLLQRNNSGKFPKPGKGDKKTLDEMKKNLDSLNNRTDNMED